MVWLTRLHVKENTVLTSIIIAGVSIAISLVGAYYMVMLEKQYVRDALKQYYTAIIRLEDLVDLLDNKGNTKPPKT